MAVSTNLPRTKAFGRILSLLENLKSTSAGTMLYQHIEQSFLELETSQQQSETIYLSLLGSLLDNLATHFSAGSEQWMQIRIMQKSLQESMSEKELHDILAQTQLLIVQARQPGEHSHLGMHETIDSLLKEHTSAAIQTAISKPKPAATMQAGSTPPDIRMEQILTPDNKSPADTAGFTPEAPFCFIDKTRNNIQAIQSSLSDQIGNAKQFNSALAKLLHSSFAAIRNLENTDDIELIKNNFLRRYAKLIKMQQDLATKFQTIDDSLIDIESNSQNLDAELSRVHRLSLTDELTQLPNRRAFLTRLDDEISRALRFDYPLTMALIDIDNFKPINDTFGHAAGDDILRHFSRNMNVVFRYHDMASRYGGEEFAVLFPNTDTTGAMNALCKLQYKLKFDPYITVNNDEVPVPTFSAGVALYSPGEDAEELIKRADIAMYKAKTSGRDHIQLDPLGVKDEASQNNVDLSVP